MPELLIKIGDAALTPDRPDKDAQRPRDGDVVAAISATERRRYWVELVCRGTWYAPHTAGMVWPVDLFDDYAEVTMLPDAPAGRVHRGLFAAYVAATEGGRKGSRWGFPRKLTVADIDSLWTEAEGVGVWDRFPAHPSGVGKLYDSPPWGTEDVKYHWPVALDGEGLSDGEIAEMALPLMEDVLDEETQEVVPTMRRRFSHNVAFRTLPDLDPGTIARIDDNHEAVYSRPDKRIANALVKVNTWHL